MINYEEESENKPKDYLRDMFIAIVMMLLIFLIIGLKSCKAPNNFYVVKGRKTLTSVKMDSVKAQTKVYATTYDTVIDSTGIIEVLPQMKR